MQFFDTHSQTPYLDTMPVEIDIYQYYMCNKWPVLYLQACCNTGKKSAALTATDGYLEWFTTMVGWIDN